MFKFQYEFFCALFLCIKKIFFFSQANLQSRRDVAGVQWQAGGEPGQYGRAQAQDSGGRGEQEQEQEQEKKKKQEQEQEQEQEPEQEQEQVSRGAGGHC